MIGLYDMIPIPDPFYRLRVDSAKCSNMILMILSVLPD